MSRLGVILNPTAGHGSVGRHSADVMMALREGGHELTDLSAANSADALQRALAAKDLDALVVVGGDGMVHLGANAAVETGLPLGVIALGSGNDAARAFGLPVHQLHESVNVINEALTHAPIPTDTIAIEFLDEHGNVAATRIVVTSVAVGFDAAVNDRANQLSWPKGELRYIAGVFLELFHFKPYGYHVSMGQDSWEFAATIVTISNTPFFGGGLKIAPEANPWNGQLEIIIAEAVPRRTILRILPQIFKGKHVNHKKVRVERAEELSIHPWEGGSEAPAVFGDGEQLGRLPARIRISPQSMLMLLPPQIREQAQQS